MADRCLLYYITDRSQFLGDDSTRRRTLLDKIAEAARAGVDCIQLREKDLRARDLELLARDALNVLHDSISLRTENREPRTRLLINSRADVALAAGADGVHLRSDDISSSDLQSVWVSCRGGGPMRAPLPMIAVSCHSSSDVLRAKSGGADFVVFAPVFEKRGVAEVRPRGLDELREACQAGIPVFALGGVTLENAPLCLQAGASGVAGIRLFQENKIEDVVRTLRKL